MLLYTLVGFLIGPDNSAVVVPSCTVPRPTVVVCICLFTVCLVCTGVFGTPVAATFFILWGGKGDEVGVVLTTE